MKFSDDDANVGDMSCLLGTVLLKLRDPMDLSRRHPKIEDLLRSAAWWKEASQLSPFCDDYVVVAH
jgi:hypothetical protein